MMMIMMVMMMMMIWLWMLLLLLLLLLSWQRHDPVVWLDARPVVGAVVGLEVMVRVTRVMVMVMAMVTIGEWLGKMDFGCRDHCLLSLSQGYRLGRTMVM